MLYDDDLNRRYIIREKTRYICFYEKKGEKTATVFDTLSGQPDEALTAYAQSIAGAKPSDFIKKMQENNISVVHRLYSRGCYKFNTDDIASRLVSMNAILQARCPDMRLVLGYTSDMEGELTTYSDTDALILCLYIRDRCISSIMLYSTFADSLDISSRTHDAFQGRGYNKLVRAAIIMVCAVIICGSHKFTYIRSVAENPISAYTLIKEFDAEITTEGVELTGDKVQDLAMVKRHYQTPEAYLTIKIDIARNLQHATRLFEETITKLTC
jgi:hypothetical protein